MRGTRGRKRAFVQGDLVQLREGGIPRQLVREIPRRGWGPAQWAGDWTHDMLGLVVATRVGDDWNARLSWIQVLNSEGQLGWLPAPWAVAVPHDV